MTPPPYPSPTGAGGEGRREGDDTRLISSEFGDMTLKGMNKKGFTLIEIIVMIVMAGILLPAIIIPFVTGVKGSGKPEKVTTAMYLGHQKMEEFMKFHYSNAALITRNLTAWANAGLPNYDYQYEILYVFSSDLTAAGSVILPDTGYKRIRIRVRDPGTDIYEVYSVVTNFP